MFAVSDIADWWEQQRKESDKTLDEFVNDHPNWFGVVVAGSVATAMDFGAGMVDVLRLGEGTAQTVNGEGMGGVAKDALRLVSVLPGVGKIASKVVPAAAKPLFGAVARLVAERPGGICTWISGAKALRQVGVVSATVEDLAAAANTPVSKLGGAWVSDIVSSMRKLGARVQPVPTMKDMAQLEQAVPREGAVLFSVEWTRGAQKVGHTLYAFRDFLGRVRIADRTGAVVRSLAELQELKPGYGAIGSATPYGDAAVVSGIRSLGATGDLLKRAATTALRINTVWIAHDAHVRTLPNGKAVLTLPLKITTTAHAETIAEAFAVRKKHGHTHHAHSGAASSSPAGSTSAAAPPHGARHHTVVRGESLSLIAKRYYGHWYKWPLIYEANRTTIGSNPNLIKPGQVFLIPERPAVSGIKKKG